MNRPDKRNALNPAIWRPLRAAFLFTRVAPDPPVEPAAAVGRIAARLAMSRRHHNRLIQRVVTANQAANFAIVRASCEPAETTDYR